MVVGNIVLTRQSVSVTWTYERCVDLRGYELHVSILVTVVQTSIYRQ